MKARPLFPARTGYAEQDPILGNDMMRTVTIAMPEAVRGQEEFIARLRARVDELEQACNVPFKFPINQRVLVKGTRDLLATVVALKLDGSGKYCLLVWWADGRRQCEWVGEEEIEASS